MQTSVNLLALLGAAMTMAACSGSSVATDRYTPEEAAALTKQWVDAAIAEQQFAVDGSCLDQELPFSELLSIDKTAHYKEIVAEPQADGSYRVAFYTDESAREAGLSPAQEVIFAAALGDAKYQWCAVVPLN